MEHFCVGMQAYSPVDAHVHPIPGDMPGYEDKIIMAGGTFVQGSSIELKCRWSCSSSVYNFHARWLSI